MKSQNFDTLEEKLSLVAETLGVKPQVTVEGVELKGMFEELSDLGVIPERGILLSGQKNRTSL